MTLLADLEYISEIDRSRLLAQSGSFQDALHSLREDISNWEKVDCEVASSAHAATFASDRTTLQQHTTELRRMVEILEVLLSVTRSQHAGEFAFASRQLKQAEQSGVLAVTCSDAASAKCIWQIMAISFTRINLEVHTLLHDLKRGVPCSEERSHSVLTELEAIQALALEEDRKSVAGGIMHTRALVQLQLHQYDAAVALCEDSIRMHKSTGKDAAEVYLVAGRALVGMLTDLDRLPEVGSHAKTNRDRMAAKAYAYLAHAVQLMPFDARPFAVRGRLSRLTGRYDCASGDFNQALLRDPAMDEALRGAMFLELEKGQCEQAGRYLAASLSRLITNAEEASRQVAVVREFQRQHAKAATCQLLNSESDAADAALPFLDHEGGVMLSRSLNEASVEWKRKHLLKDVM